MLVNVEWRRVVESASAGTLLRFRREFAERVWSDPDDIAFATGVGVTRGPFQPFRSVIEPDPDTPEHVLEDQDNVPEPVETPHGRMQQLGVLFGGDLGLYVSLEDGEIWADDWEYEELRRINGDLSSLAYVLYKLEAEAPTDEESDDPYAHVDAAAIIRQDTRRFDRLPFRMSFWEQVLDEYQLYY
ncbi:SUKH-4 family immunity protein [Nocardia sp. NPDC005998]|uniref:SUKH-4 family immunity protein n=1 Tax=Nocardia sp. NPDC005998 TaxID=3156894 RepID=UPI0033BB2D1E